MSMFFHESNCEGKTNFQYTISWDDPVIFFHVGKQTNKAILQRVQMHRGKLHLRL